VANSDEIKGKTNVRMGAARESAGKLTGDQQMEADGNAQKHEGKIQNAWGETKHVAGDAIDAVKSHLGH